MGNILSGLVLVNGTDIWTEYGVFLVEDRRGGMENLTAILTPSKAKKDTAVDIREEHGEKYSPVLTPRNADCTKFTPLTYLWTEGVHAGKFRVKFREPKPII